MKAGPTRAVASTIGAAGMLAAGSDSGEWVWMVAGAGALAAVGGVFDRQFAYLQVLAALAAAVGLAAAGHDWLVPVVVTATFASVELAAAADRTTVVRSLVPDLPAVGRDVALAAVLSTGVVIVGLMPRVTATAAVLAACAGAVVATRVIAR